MTPAQRRQLRKDGFRIYHLAEQEWILRALNAFAPEDETQEQTDMHHRLVRELEALASAAQRRHGLASHRSGRKQPQTSGCVVFLRRGVRH